MRRQFLSRPIIPSLRVRLLYRRLSYRTVLLCDFRPGMQGRVPLSDENTQRQFASIAGLTPKDVFDVVGVWVYPDLDTAVRGMCAAGVAVTGRSDCARYLQ